MSSGDAAPATPLRPAVVGRDEELTRLTDFADAAVEHGARMVLLSGDAGIGKSTLTAHFLDQLRESGWGTHVGHCIEYADRPLPFGPVVAVLRSLLLDDLERVDDLVGHHREDLAGLVPELGDGDAGSASLAGDVDRLFDAIAALLTKASDGRPIAFLIEDIHWSDAATRDLLTSLVHNLRSARVLMLVTERSGALEKGNPLRTWLAEQRRFPNVHSMELEGLGEDDLAAQVTSLTGEDADISFVAELLARTGGNPYFAHELVVAHGQQSGELPTSLREFLTARLSELGPDEREVLRAVAIAGGSVAHPVLAAMLADLDLGPLIRTLFDRGILVVEGQTYQFTHALLREAILEDVLPFEAEELHRSAAEALEANLGTKPQLSDLVGLAVHCARAHDDERTLRYSVEAALAAARVTAFDTAGEMASQALELWDVGGGESTANHPRIELLLRAVDWLALSSQGSQALAVADAALGSWIDDDESRARVESAASLVEFGLSRVSAAETRVETALHLVGSAQTISAAEVHLGAARLSLRLGDITTAMNSADKAAQLTASDSDLHVEALNTLGLGLGVTSSLDEGLGLIEEARSLARTRSLPAEVARSYRNEMLVRLYREGRSPESVRALEEGLEYAERHCGPQNRLRLKWDLATAYLESGDFGRAEPLVSDLLSSRADANARLWSLHTAAIHALGVGELDSASQLLAESATLTDRTATSEEAGQQARLEAEVERRRGNAGGALPLILEALRHSEQSDNITFWREHVVEHARVLRELAIAQRGPEPKDIDDAARMRRSYDAPGTVNDALRALLDFELAVAAGAATIGQAEAAADRLVDANAHYEAVQTQLLAAELGLHADSSALTDALDDLVRAASERGVGWVRQAAIDIARNRRLAVDQGESSEVDLRVNPAQDLPHFLTLREVEVMSLLAEGLTNKAIGERLFVSPRTVSTHVSNLLAKLGVSTRGEAAAAYHRLGLAELVESAV